MILRKETVNPVEEAADLPWREGDLAAEAFRDADVLPESRAELLDPNGWDKLLETFARTMKLAVVLTDAEGRVVGQCHNPQPAWSLARRASLEAENGCPFCLTSPAFCNAAREALSTDGPAIAEDQAGLTHVAVPLLLEGRLLGFLIAGQVFSRYPEPLLLERVARDRGISRQQLWQEAIRQVPMTRATLELCGNLLRSLGQEVLGERYGAILHRKLAQTSWRYRLFIEGAKGYALYTVTRADRVTSWNSGAERLFGYTEAEMLGEDSASLMVTGSVQREAWEQNMVEADRAGSAEYEGWGVRKDGTRFLGAGTLASMGDGDAREYGILVHDITKLRQSEEDLQQAQKLEGIGVLAGGIAHDFNNLLTGMMGGLSFAKSRLLGDDAAYRAVEIAEQSSARAAELISQLLAYAGKGKFVITRFDISGLIQEMLPLISASIPKAVTLDLALTPGLPWMEGDASQIRQIAMNLIINGAEAIGAKGGAVRVSTGVRGDGVEIFIQVKDSGSGMSEAIKAKIFEPFFTTKFTGRGLGLAAVSGIVSNHKGKMQVDSIVGQGSTFTVTFPAVPAEVPRLAAPPVSITAHGAETILVVDDEPSLREMAAAVLKRSGYCVLAARNGHEAVEIFRKDSHKIAAVLLDMTMPVMGGHEAFSLIRKIRPGVPIVVSSGYSEVGTREELGHDAVGGYIQKPYSASRLVESLQLALQNSAPRGLRTSG